MKINSGVSLWEKAKTLIPGGNQLLSKRSERFLPGLWPAYYNKAKGCEVWDLDGNRYYDFCGMGVGSCILGYADKDVNNAVIRAINNASMSSLNAKEEIELAEKLISLHPWAQMVMFSRTGGEACAIAIRIARAASGRTKIAFCGYHGWHDWYMSANLGDADSLAEHLLPGLKPLGVPAELRNTAFPFSYNCIDGLRSLVEQYGKEIGVIIMEPMRDSVPENNFLEEVRRIADEINAVLIFDEVSVGFRMCLGGLHMYLGVNPDIAVFGKALGNGFPISAIVGRKDIMNFARHTFISSTFWTDRIGFVAALATLKKMEEKKVQENLVAHGDRIMRGWKKLAQKHKLEVRITGIAPFCHISFGAEKGLEAQTLYTQEMLRKGYLVGAAIATTYAYTEKIVDKFIEDSDEVFEKISKGLEAGKLEHYLTKETLKQGL